MVDRVVEILQVVRVESHLRREEWRIERDLLVPRPTVDPCEVAEGERGLIVHGRRGGSLSIGRLRALWSSGARFQGCQLCFEQLDACFEGFQIRRARASR